MAGASAASSKCHLAGASQENYVIRKRREDDKKYFGIENGVAIRSPNFGLAWTTTAASFIAVPSQGAIDNPQALPEASRLTACWWARSWSNCQADDSRKNLKGARVQAAAYVSVSGWPKINERGTYVFVVWHYSSPGGARELEHTPRNRAPVL